MDGRFDAEAFYQLAHSPHEPVSTTFGNPQRPSFDHAIKDPVADKISIRPKSRVAIFEGL
jgi:pantothenate kinase